MKSSILAYILFLILSQSALAQQQVVSETSKTDMAGDSIQSQLLGLKTVIRTLDFDKSKQFYTEILNLPIIVEYDDGDGSRGCIVRIGGEGSTSNFEISEITQSNSYFDKSFVEGIKNDKVSIQIKTEDIEYWSRRLKIKWVVKGPIKRPWGSTYLYLRDPDGLQIIIYQE